MNKKVVTILGSVAIVVITIVYIYLGGLNKVEYELVDIDGYYITGKAFEGEGDSKEIEDLFFTMKSFVQEDKVNGILTIVHYKDDDPEDDVMKLFIGIKTKSQVPMEGYETINLVNKTAMRASIEAHNSVMPSPKTIEDNLIEKASQMNLNLEDFTIEQYVSENVLLIDMPVK